MIDISKTILHKACSCCIKLFESPSGSQKRGHRMGICFSISALSHLVPQITSRSWTRFCGVAGAQPGEQGSTGALH